MCLDVTIKSVIKHYFKLRCHYYPQISRTHGSCKNGHQAVLQIYFYIGILKPKVFEASCIIKCGIIKSVIAKAWKDLINWTFTSR